MIVRTRLQVSIIMQILRAVAGAKIVFPQLKTISGGWKQSLNGKEVYNSHEVHVYQLDTLCFFK